MNLIVLKPSFITRPEYHFRSCLSTVFSDMKINKKTFCESLLIVYNGFCKIKTNQIGDSMKRFILSIALLAFLAVPAFAETVTIQHKDHGNDKPLTATVHDKTEDLHESFDYGAYLDLVLWESKDGNFTIGNKNTWEVNRKEITSLVGATIKVNSIFGK